METGGPQTTGGGEGGSGVGCICPPGNPAGRHGGPQPRPTSGLRGAWGSGVGGASCRPPPLDPRRLWRSWRRGPTEGPGTRPSEHAPASVSPQPGASLPTCRRPPPRGASPHPSGFANAGAGPGARRRRPPGVRALTVGGGAVSGGRVVASWGDAALRTCSTNGRHCALAAAPTTERCGDRAWPRAPPPVPPPPLPPAPSATQAPGPCSAHAGRQGSRAREPPHLGAEGTRGRPSSRGWVQSGERLLLGQDPLPGDPRPAKVAKTERDPPGPPRRLFSKGLPAQALTAAGIFPRRSPHRVTCWASVRTPQARPPSPRLGGCGVSPAGSSRPARDPAPVPFLAHRWGPALCAPGELQRTVAPC